MAKFESKNRRLSWFNVAIHPELRKADSAPPGSTDPYTQRLLRLFQHNEERPSVSEEEYDNLTRHLDQHSKFLALHHLVSDPVLGQRTEALLHHAATDPNMWSHDSDLTPLDQNHMEAVVQETLDPEEDRVGPRDRPIGFTDSTPNRMAQAFAVDHAMFPQWALAAGYGRGRNPEVASYNLSQREPITASANRLLRGHLDRIAIQNGYVPHPMGPDDLSRDQGLAWVEESATHLRLPEAASYRRPRRLPEQVNEGPAPEMMDERFTTAHRPNRSISSLRNSLLGKSKR